jgi:hypothetical protein
MSRNLRLLIILLIVATVAGYVIFVTIPTRLAQRSYQGAKTLAEDFRRAFQFTPEVRVNNTIVLNQQASVFEVAVLEQSFEHRYVWENSWLGSTKKIFISGTFNAKVGFDLQKRVSINLKDDVAYVTLAPPRTLSVESLGNTTYRDEQGIWNWVNVDDRTRATNAFIRDARRYADQAKFREDAKHEMETRLRELLKPYAANVVIEYDNTVVLPDKR